MNTNGPGLGNLSSRFFAYTQLKNKDIVRTGELIPVLGITKLQESNLLRRLSDSGWIVRLKRGTYLVPPRIPAGGLYSPGIALILQKIMEEIGGTYQICGPTAFYFYGFDDQVPTITYVYNNRISGSRTIGSLAFQFIKVANDRLGAVNILRNGEGTEIIYPSKVRTLMDAVYDWSRFNSLPRGYDWIRDEIQGDKNLGAELAKVTGQYGNQATVRRIGYLLESLLQNPRAVASLQCRLSNSTALIPWVPGRPARGTVNRAWGVIVNG